MKKIDSQQGLLKESYKELFEKQSVSHSENSSEIIKEIDLVNKAKRFLGMATPELDIKDIESGDKNKIRSVLNNIVKNTPFDLTEALQGLDEKNQKIIIDAFNTLLTPKNLDSDIGNAFYKSIDGKITTNNPLKDKLIDLSIQATVAKKDIDINQYIQAIFNQAYLPRGQERLLNNFNRVKTKIVEFVKALIAQLNKLNLGAQLEFNEFSSELNAAKQEESKPNVPPFYYLGKFIFDPNSMVAIAKRKETETQQIQNFLLDTFSKKMSEIEKRKEFIRLLKQKYDNPIEQAKFLSLDTDKIMNELEKIKNLAGKTAKATYESIEPTRWQRLANIIKD